MGAPTDFVYNNARQLFGTAQLNWLTSNIQAMLLGPDYVPSLNDKYVSDIPTAAILQRDAVCTNITMVNGIANCLIPEYQSITSDYPVQGVLLYVHTGDDTTSTLIYYSATGPGFPFALQGFNYYVGPDASSGGWFQV